jgi:hypothetical protein
VAVRFLLLRVVALRCHSFVLIGLRSGRIAESSDRYYLFRNDVHLHSYSKALYAMRFGKFG